MKIKFDDGGYLQFQRSQKSQHVFVIVAVRSPEDPLKLLVNSAEVKLSELIEGVRSVAGPLLLNNEKKESDKNE